MKPEKHPFDELIRQRITDLPAGPSRGWEGLERKLDAPDPMDTAVASKLAALTPTPLPGSWEKLSEKLTAREAEAEAALDTAVAGGLQQSSPAPISGWALLAARLELIGKRREMVACMKISEAALLLSLILLFFRFGNLPQENRKPQADQNATAAFPITVAETPAFRPKEVDPPEAVLSAVLPAPTNAAVAPLASVPLASRQVSREAPLPAVRPLNSTEATGQLSFLEFALQLPEQNVHPPFQLPSLLDGEPIQYYLNLFVSPVDFNQVVTQTNQSLGITAGSELSTGYSLGGLIDISQGHNALETGFIYGYRAYVPAEILRLENEQPVQNEEAPVRYGRLRYHTVSVPLNYEREIFRDEKWQFSGGVGMVVNVILSSKFRLDGIYTVEDLERQIIQYRLKLQDEGIISAPGRASSNHEILYPEAGVFQGGSLLSNSSLYLSGNLRIERLLNDKWSLYFSPTVSRLITMRPGDGGKGPLEDRIHNTMLRFGTRVRLSDK